MAEGNFYAKMSAYLSLDNSEFLTKLEKTNRQINKLSKKAGDLGRALTQNVTAPLLAGAAGAVKFAADIEALETSFVSLTGGAAQAANAVKQLNEFTAKTPFQLEGVAKAARQLLAAGVEENDLQSNLQFLGDIAATTGGRIEDIAAIFAKVNAKGKVELENLNQLAERGIPIFTALSEATGLPASELGAGRVTVDQFNQVLKSMAENGGFAEGAMERLSGTLKGRVSTAMDNLKLAAASLGEELLPLAKEAASAITTWAQAIQKLSPATKKLIVDISTFAAVLGPTILLFSKMAPAIKIMNAAMTTSSVGVIPKLVAGLKALRATMLTALGPIGLIAAGLALVVSAAVTRYLNNVRKDLNAIADRAEGIEKSARKNETTRLKNLRTEAALLEENLKKIRNMRKEGQISREYTPANVDSQVKKNFAEIRDYLYEIEDAQAKQEGRAPRLITYGEVLAEIERRRLENFKQQNKENFEITETQFKEEKKLLEAEEGQRKAAHEAEKRRIREEGRLRREEFERRYREIRTGTDPDNQRLADIGILGDVEANDIYDREVEAQRLADERRRTKALELKDLQTELTLQNKLKKAQEEALETAKEALRTASTDEAAADAEKAVNLAEGNLQNTLNAIQSATAKYNQADADYADATTKYWLATDAARVAYVDKLFEDNNKLLSSNNVTAEDLIKGATRTAEAYDLISARYKEFVEGVTATDGGYQFTDRLTGKIVEVTEEDYKRIKALYEDLEAQLESAPGQFENAISGLTPGSLVQEDLTKLANDLARGVVPEAEYASRQFQIIMDAYRELIKLKDILVNSDSDAARGLGESLEVPESFEAFLNQLKGFDPSELDAIMEAYNDFAGNIDVTQARINAAIGVGTQFVDMLKQSFFQAQETGERFGKTLVTAMKNALKQVAVTIVSLIVLFTALAIAIALATGGMNLKGAAKAIGGVEGGFFRNMAAFTGSQGFGIDSNVFAKSATAGDSGTNMSLVVRGNDLHSAQDGAARGYQRLYG